MWSSKWAARGIASALHLVAPRKPIRSSSDFIVAVGSRTSANAHAVSSGMIPAHTEDDTTDFGKRAPSSLRRARGGH